ncbi:myb-like protein X isoform X2 [Athalia rosae]|uniref:myb-like protein X isoform X2 n=1 Tax=Athalia rosae TaxID=37344 RepID=UPI00203357EF|nr:myb-like protein X isoform X2 [Athalia rosae]
MPRFVVNESEDEYEPKTGRRTRLASAATTTDSPVRRSTRIRQGSVNPDGSSPESTTGVAVAVTRTTRRRAAAAVVETAVPEPAKNLRSRKSSVSSNISELLESESNPATPKSRSNNRQSIIDDASDESRPKTRRRSRATSESKSPPLARTTRRTRATSIDPEPNIERSTKGATQPITQAATPTKRRRTLVSVLPTEPVLPEEPSEDKMDDVSEEVENQDSPEKSTTKPFGSPFGGIQTLSKDEISVQQSSSLSNMSPTEKSPNGSSGISLSKEDIEILEVTPDEESVLLQSPRQSQSGDTVNITNAVGNSATKIKQHSTDRSKELGIEIEDLLNKSTEEQESSPGNKENQKINIAPEKFKKSLEFTVADTSVVRRHSSTPTLRKSLDKKADIGLDERVLSKSRHTIGSTYLTPTNNHRRKSRRSIDAKDDESVGSTMSVQKFTQEKKSNHRMSPQIILQNLVLSDEMMQRNTELSDVERRSSKTSSCVKLDETVVENEITEDFKLYHSGDSSDEAKSEFCLKDNDDNGCVEKSAYLAETLDGDSSFKKSEKITLEQDSDSNADINNGETSEKSTPKSQLLKNVDCEEIEKVKGKSPSTMRVPLTVVNKPTESYADVSSNKSECEVSRKSEPFVPQKEVRSNPENEISDNDADMCADTTEQSSDTNNTPMSFVGKRLSPRRDASMNSKDNILNEKGSRGQTDSRISDIDCNLAVSDLFQNISTAEWNKKPKSPAAKNRWSVGNKSLTAEVSSPTASKRVSQNETEFNTVLSPRTEKSPQKLADEKQNQFKYLNDGDSSSSASMTLIIDESVSTEGKDIVTMSDTLSKKIIPALKSEDSDMNKMITGTKVSPTKRKSVDVSAKSIKSKNLLQICDTESEDESVPMNTDVLEDSITLKNENKSSPFKSTSKLVETEHTDEPMHSSESEVKGTKKDSSNSKRRSLEKKNDTLLANVKKSITRNCSITAVVDSDSASENLTDPDCSNSVNDESHLMPSFLFNISTSDEEDNSQNSIDSDVARDLNLAGDDNIEYSDDDVPGDDCRASESEHSNMDDDGSDLDDFIVNDNEVESSEDSEDEENDVKTKDSTTFKRKRILQPTESDNETDSDPDKEVDADDLQITKNENKSEKQKRKSLNKSDNSNGSNTIEEPLMQFSQSPPSEKVPSKLNFSQDSNKSLSSTKSRKVNMMEDSQSELDHSFGELENKSDKKLRKNLKLSKSMLDMTVDLCTPNSQETGKSSSSEPGSSIGKKTITKLRKALVKDLETLTPEKIEGDEQETTVGRTPKNDKRSPKKITPKLAEQNKRDSIQIIREIENLKIKTPGRNRSMDPPNSETPVTKFLRKEKLNESLPVLELGKKTKAFVNSQKLAEMNEEEQEGGDDSRTENGEKIADNYENNEGVANEKDYDTAESNDEVTGDKSDKNDDKDDETDEEPNEIDKDSDDEEEDEIESNDEEDESSEEDYDALKSEARVKGRPGSLGSKKGHTEKQAAAELGNDGKSTPIPDKKSSIKNQSKDSGSILPNEQQNEFDKSSIDSKKSRSLSSPATNSLNERKRSRLEYSDTPVDLFKIKKMRTVSQKNTPQLNSSDSDEGPEIIGFSEARTVALETMKNVTASLQAAKEVRKKKCRDRLEKVRKQQEAKADKLSKQQETTMPKLEKNKPKRLPDNFLETLSDVHPGPTKKRKLLKKEEPAFCPSKYQFSPGKSTKSIKVKSKVTSVSTVGSTTQFSVVNLKKVEAKPKKAAAVASFREKMLARNPREPASAFAVHRAKLKASGQHLIPQKKA